MSESLSKVIWALRRVKCPLCSKSIPFRATICESCRQPVTCNACGKYSLSAIKRTEKLRAYGVVGDVEITSLWCRKCSKVIKDDVYDSVAWRKDQFSRSW